MKVICINNNPNPIYGHASLAKLLTEGESYNVVEIVPTKYGPGYILAETIKEQFKKMVTFDAARFVVIGGPDERDRLEAWQEQKMTTVDRLLMACADMMPEAEMEPGAMDRIWQGIVKKEEGCA
jgi:hypothetical protein